MTKKVFLILTSMILFGTTVFGQVYKNRAKQFAYKSKDNYGRWSKWTEWEDCNILVVINIEKSRFTIYSKETQEFDIVTIYPKEYDDEGIEVFRMLVIDKDGLRCNIRQRFVKSDTYSSQLYIDYSDYMYVYNMVVY